MRGYNVNEPRPPFDGRPGLHKPSAKRTEPREAGGLSYLEVFPVEFQTIIADPPWPYNNPEGPRAAPDHRPKSWDRDTGAAGSVIRYGSVRMADLLALRPPVTKNAHAYLWTTNAFMVEVHDLMRAWGFTPKTILTWVKAKKDGESASMRCGYYFRGATEHIVFGVRGSLRLATKDALPTAFFWPRMAHSVKPDDFYNVVEKASPGPYLELFARPSSVIHRPNWTRVGNEITGRDIATDIELLRAGVR